MATATRGQTGSALDKEGKEGAKNLDILVADDEEAIRRVLRIFLESRGHRVEMATNSSEVMAAAAKQTFDILLLDVRLGSESGLDLITPLHRRFPWMKIIVITAYATVESAVKAINAGASDYLPKPFSPEQVYHAIDKVHQLAKLEIQVEELSSTRSRSQPPAVNAQLESAEPRMQRVLEMAAGVAATDATILIRGESGTGKTMLARKIHDASHRANHPFVVVSCPSLSHELLESELFGHMKGSFTGAHRDYQGRIASAQRGTLFLDEIGEMPPSLQSKMLRFIQDREYESVGDTITKKADVRIVTATNADLEKYVHDGRFREDLFFRLNVIEIEMPSLRERSADLLPMAQRMLAELSVVYNRAAREFSEEAKAFLTSYHWPGNIRELRNVVERSILLSPGPIIGIQHLNIKASRFGAVTPTPPMDEAPTSEPGIGARTRTLEEVEEAHIKHVLATCASLDDAAKTLGIDQTTLYRRRKRYGII